MTGTTASKTAPRLDFVAKVTGQAEFVSDVVVPNMLHGKILRSPIPHGHILSIDVSEAVALPGVIAVLSGQDLSGSNTHWGLFLKDRPLIAIDRVRYVGEPVALVAAIDESIAEEALDLIAVDYSELPYVTDAEAAMEPGAPILHDSHDTLADFYFKGKARPIDGTNIFQDYTFTHGDVAVAIPAIRSGL